MIAVGRLSRRGFLVVGGAAAGGLLVGCDRLRALATGTPPPLSESGVGELSAYVVIGTDESVTLTVDESEMGQGVMTALPMIIADELEVPWQRVRTQNAIPYPKRYGYLVTASSTSVRENFTRLRTVGAAARDMLIAAAAAAWGVDAASCTASEGHVVHAPSGRRSSYGSLAAAAAAQTAPAQPTLKPTSSLRLVGTTPQRLDIPAKVNGSAVYGIDVRLPDMLTAVVRRPPTLGGSVKTVAPQKARAVRGVVDVLRIDAGVAVVAEHTWAALQGRDALELTFDPGKHAELSSAALAQTLDAALDAGAVATNVGDVEKALQGGRVIEARYDVPYLAHAPLEPMNATVRVAGGRAEVWAPTQAPTETQEACARALGLRPRQVTVHTTFLGGGFGRRAQADFVVEAAQIAKAHPGRAVKVVWSRDDDMRHGQFRPCARSRLRATLGDDGMPIAWWHQLACPEMVGKDSRGIDAAAVEGAADIPYAIANLRVSAASPLLPVPVTFWRSVGHSQNAFVVESFLDELAHAGGVDPLQLRLRLLRDKPRHRRVLERAAAAAGWGTPAPEGRARGLAVHESYGSFCAEVVEVSDEGGVPRVHKVTAALDCGSVVHPRIVESQVQSAIVYGLSAALAGRITIEGGAVQQAHFGDYPVLRISQMPHVDTVIVAEGEAHGGVGEPPLPPLAPAVANAWFALTGKRVRSLPFASEPG